jgi:hypothetical protein
MGYMKKKEDIVNVHVHDVYCAVVILVMLKDGKERHYVLIRQSLAISGVVTYVIFLFLSWELPHSLLQPFLLGIVFTNGKR